MQIFLSDVHVPSHVYFVGCECAWANDALASGTSRGRDASQQGNPGPRAKNEIMWNETSRSIRPLPRAQALCPFFVPLALATEFRQLMLNFVTGNRVIHHVKRPFMFTIKGYFKHP